MKELNGCYGFYNSLVFPYHKI